MEGGSVGMAGAFTDRLQGDNGVIFLVFFSAFSYDVLQMQCTGMRHENCKHTITSS